MDYNNGKIYVIRNHCNDMVYIGSTTQSLSKRFSKHKCDSKRRTLPLYNAMNELDISNFYIELVEEYPCDNREQLCAKEGYYIREFDSYNNGYNGKIEGRSKKEYRKDNIEDILEKQKEYYEENKEDILEKQKQHYQENKEQINNKAQKYYQENKDTIKKQVKKYQENNKQNIKDYQKTYYKQNKEKVKEHNNTKYICSCGSIIQKGSKSRHLKTKKHLSYMSSI